MEPRDIRGLPLNYYPSGRDAWGNMEPCGKSAQLRAEARGMARFDCLWFLGYRPCIHRAPGYQKLCYGYDCANCLTGALPKLAAPREGSR